MLACLRICFLSVLLWSFSAQAKSVVPERDSAAYAELDPYVQVGIRNLTRLVQSNQQNEQQGQAEKNQYVFSVLEELPDQPGTYFQNTTESAKRIRLKTDFDAELNSALIEINRSLPSSVPKIYVGLDAFLGQALTQTKLTNSAGNNQVDFKRFWEIVTPKKERNLSAIEAKYNAIYTQILASVGGSMPSAGIELIRLGTFEQYELKDGASEASKTWLSFWTFCNFAYKHPTNDPAAEKRYLTDLAPVVFDGFNRFPGHIADPKQPGKYDSDHLIAHLRRFAFRIKQAMLYNRTTAPCTSTGNEITTYTQLLTSQWETVSVSELVELINEAPCADALSNLSTSVKLGILGENRLGSTEIVGDPISGEVTTDKEIGQLRENAVVSIFKAFKNQEVSQLFEALEANNARLLVRYIAGIDDSFVGIGADNYKRLIQTITQLAAQSDAFQAKVQQVTAANFLNSFVPFYYQSIWDQFQFNPPHLIPRLVTDVKLEGRQVKVTNRLNVGTFNSGLPPATFPAFQPVFMSNRATLTMVEEFANKELQGGKEGAWVPAIVLKYASDKGDMQTSGDLINAGIDIASMATGAGEVRLAISAYRKAAVILDLAASGVSLADNLSNYTISNEYPLAKAFLDAMNALSGGLGLSRIGRNTTPTFNQLYEAISDETDLGIKRQKIVEFLNHLETIGKEVEQLTEPQKQLAKAWISRLKRESKALGDSDLSQRIIRAEVSLFFKWKLFSHSTLADIRKQYYDGKIIQRFSRYGVTIEEESVIRFYTTQEGYQNLNRALRGEIQMTDFFSEFETMLNSGLKKLPKSEYNNNLFRWESLTEEQINVLYKEGEINLKKAFTSTTYSMDALIDAYRERTNLNVLFILQGKNGKLIEPASTLQKEQEVLFNSNSKFKVEKVGYSMHPDQEERPGEPVRTIWLTEI